MKRKKDAAQPPAYYLQLLQQRGVPGAELDLEFLELNLICRSSSTAKRVFGCPTSVSQ